MALTGAGYGLGLVTHGLETDIAGGSAGASGQLTCSSLISEVQALCGRTGDTVLITSAQVTTWFNEAQRDIVDRIPGLHAMTFRNTTSLDTTTTRQYALADITAGDYTTQAISHIWNVFYLDGNESTRLHFVMTDEYDAHWPDPTHADGPFYKPYHWTRRGQYIEIRPVCSTEYIDHDLRVDGQFYARDFSTDATQYSDLSAADEGLKWYALSKAWRAIGNLDKAIDYSRSYEQWMDVYEGRNNRLLEWNGSMYSDRIK